MVLGFSMTGFANGSVTEKTQSSAVTSQKTTESTDHQMMTYNGKVVSMNTADHTMVVKGKEGDRTFDVSKMSTTVKTDDTVHVRYYTDPNGNMVVSSVSSGVKTSAMHHRRGMQTSQNDRYNDYGTDKSGYAASDAGTGGVITGSDIGGGGVYNESR
jgi:hypothetical protein